jgi:hypothetical protein
VASSHVENMRALFQPSTTQGCQDKPYKLRGVPDTLRQFSANLANLSKRSSDGARFDDLPPRTILSGIGGCRFRINIRLEAAS